MMALARRIVSGEGEEDAETVEEVFAQARDAEAVAEEYLVDEGWKAVEVEPEAVESPPRTGNGTNGNGHQDAFDIGSTVELVPANGHAAASVNRNGNGHHDEAPEPQRSLFSWAEFMAEEPVKSKGRSWKPQHAAASLFGLALSLDQEWGDGVGRPVCRLGRRAA